VNQTDDPYQELSISVVYLVGLSGASARELPRHECRRLAPNPHHHRKIITL
jgi:hypothetical protein